MSELRQDILTGDWVIFAANRKKRPYDFIKKSISKIGENECQFCPGNENYTTDAVYQDGELGKWSIRVFPNMFPAVNEEISSVNGENFYNCIEGFGFHEVLVDTPEHEGVIHDFSVTNIENILNVLKARFDYIKSQEKIKYVQIFKNCGPDAGASISHSHWQIMGIPIIPEELRTIFDKSKKYFEEKAKCIFCEIIEHEIKKKERIVTENDSFLVFAPFASKISYELWIIPKEHISSFSDFDNKKIKDLSKILKYVLLRVKELREGVCYNICFEDMPVWSEDFEHFHWYARILPRMGNPAGFEFATGSFINHILPENAAEFYKELNI